MPSVWLYYLYYLFLRLRSVATGDRTPISCMRGERSTSTPPRRYNGGERTIQSLIKLIGIRILDNQIVIYCMPIIFQYLPFLFTLVCNFHFYCITLTFILYYQLRRLALTKCGSGIENVPRIRYWSCQAISLKGYSKTP